MPTTPIYRHFQNVLHPLQPEIQIHYRTCGDHEKQPIILLHPSPLSSRFMEPMLQLFGQTHHAIAWDTPGYGDSDALASGGKTLEEYVDCLVCFMDSLEQEKAVIYGSATGAQMAIELEKKYPQRVNQLLLENVAWFYDEELEEMFQHYFPDLSPQTDGSHLNTTWKIVTHLFQFFPWYDTSLSARLDLPTPTREVLQAIFLDYLKAGKGYANAYIAAMQNDKPERLKQVKVPTHILVWKDSMIYRYCERLMHVEFPKNIHFYEVDAGMNNRLSRLSNILAQADG